MKNVNIRLGASKSHRALMRSYDLFLDHLTPEEREIFNKTGKVSVKTSQETLVIDSSKKYTPNIYVKGADFIGYCLLAELHDGRLAPWFDLLLAQYMLLKHSPQDFYRKANKTYRFGMLT